MSEIADEKNDYNLNIGRYVSTASAEVEVDLAEVNAQLVKINERYKAAVNQHNDFLKELGLSPLPI
jgi:type I restriction enzyme M protein